MTNDVEILNIEAVENNNNRQYKKSKKKREKKLSKYTKILLIIDAIAIICFFLVYGPINYFKNMIVTNALTSMSHKYFAYVFYNQEMIMEIVGENKIIETGETTDTSAIKITEVEKQDTYESIYEEQILKKDEGNDLYKIITIEETDYTAYISVIYDPSRVELVATKRMNGGQYGTIIAQNNNAIIAINAGGFSYSGRVMRPSGMYIEDGKIIYNSTGVGQMVGMSKDNILVLANITAEEAIEQGIRDAMDFGPFLIVNGVASEFKGNGGYGNRPRSAIGQRQDGIILFVTVDGKRGLYGVTMKELTNIFVRYKAYNAANLDGGGSTTLVVDGKLKNAPVSWNHTGQRGIANMWILR